jgi:hypothetical protein
MSWWDTGEGDDVIGDRPADILTAALADLAGRREREAGERPSLSGLLAGLAEALSGTGRQARVTAETGAGSVGGDSDAARAEGSALAPALREALAKIHAAYQERWERDARPSEVARVAAFVLGPSPERYLRASEAQGLELSAVRAEVGAPA